MTQLNAEQLAAINEPGVVFVSAGAGTGKTAVLVERFVAAVAERGFPVDSVLVITYTERAAGELRARIRTRLRELERHELARDLDRAWISTIHGFCSRLLRQHALDAGLDPRFRILDESQARILRSEAFTAALADFCADRHADRLRLLTTYGARGLFSMLGLALERLRSNGRPLELASAEESTLPQALERLLEVGEAVVSADAEGVSGHPQVEASLAAARSGSPAESLLDLSDFRVENPEGGQLSEYLEAVATVEEAALEDLAARDRALLEELLVRFDDSYRAAKSHESALDFEDLQLTARDLLSQNESVREQTRWRFRALMVDEFQDTNRLQCELIDLISSEELFFVGDEFQSIYRFRHADVEVFRERRAASAGLLALTRNYRSRPEVLSVVNQLFEAEFGEDYEPLSAAARFPDPSFSPAVELLVTDKASYRGSSIDWRSAEARHLAARIRGLVDAGECEPGEIVLLFAAGTDADRYEEALRVEGLPTYRAAGKGYFGQQQVFDLVAYLRLLHNRYDDKALLSVLASPLVGVSNDALVSLREAAGRRPLFVGLERDMPDDLSRRDRRLLQAFSQRYERLTRVAGTVGLEQLCDRVVVEHDYDLAVLARWDGRRRYANMRKLGRLARSYAELKGEDIEGFVHFLRDQESVGVREAEAVAEEEGADAVRLLTIHAAKGLEFKVVVVADAGRGPPVTTRDEILCLADGRLGFRVVDPTTGERRPSPGYEELRAAERRADEAETRRLLYVAMTRAIDRLIISGAVDPTGKREGATSIRWLLDRLDVDLIEDGPVEIESGGARVLLRMDRFAPTEAEGPPLPAEQQLELFVPSAEGTLSVAPELPALAAVPEPSGDRVRQLSYSALALFKRCSYRFYAERIVGLSPLDEREPTSVPGLGAAEVGDVVHVLLERGVSADEAREQAAALYPNATAEDLERVEGLVRSWQDSALAVSLKQNGRVEPERPFTFEHAGVLLHGRFDLFGLTGDAALVVDYKTNRLDDLEPQAVVEEEYALQRLVYALAAFRANAAEVEVSYIFLERPRDVVATTFTRAQVPELEAELSELIRSIQAGDFRPTPSEIACAGCPVLDRVCAGPGLPRAAQPVLDVLAATT